MKEAHDLACTLLVTSNNRKLSKEERLCLEAVMGHLNGYHRVMELVRLKNLENLRKEFYGLDFDDDEPDDSISQQPT